MNRKHHILVIDPIAFAGGSKVATRNMLDLEDKRNVHITVVTADPVFWKDNWIETSPLYEPGFLARKQQGIFYFLRHLVILLSILYARVRHGKFHLALGASGPGVDLSLYLAEKLLSFKIIQLIHGPVAASKTIARALMFAHTVFYLESTRESLVRTLTTRHSRTKALHLLSQTRFKPFTNGLPIDQWPTACNTEAPVIFWAASLLKWKGLETLLLALQKTNASAYRLIAIIIFGKSFKLYATLMADPWSIAYGESISERGLTNGNTAAKLNADVACGLHAVVPKARRRISHLVNPAGM